MGKSPVLLAALAALRASLVGDVDNIRHVAKP
jgi:hypothetical protein